MSDRLNGLFVTLSRDMHEDDATPLIDAILQLKGVEGISTRVADFSDTIAQMRVRNEISKALFDVLHPQIAKATTTVGRE